MWYKPFYTYAKEILAFCLLSQPYRQIVKKRGSKKKEKIFSVLIFIIIIYNCFEMVWLIWFVEIAWIVYHKIIRDYLYYAFIDKDSVAKH